MPTLADLGDAAIATCKVLDEAGIDFGIFGGYAIAVLGGPRQSKDLDCVVNCSKDWLINLLSNKQGFVSLANQRPDVAQFFWGQHNVLVEFFPTSMTNLKCDRVRVGGPDTDPKTTKLLNVVFLFKGKLRAAATRMKHSDAADLLWLEGKFNKELKAHTKEYDLRCVGKALKRYSHLEHAFKRLNIDIKACKAVTQDWSPEDKVENPPELNEVQNGLMFGLRAA